MKILKSLLILFCISTAAFSQTPKDVFSASEITWFGLDFTRAKFLGSFAAYGDAGQKNGQQIRDLYFKGWNDLILKESEKYNLKEAYKKKSVPYDISLVTERNNAVDPDAIFSEKPEDKNRLTKDDISAVIKEYKSNKTGVGLVYVVESFDKPGEEALIWVTFFDIPSKTILLTEKFSGKPGGFGIKNYWARTILNVIEKSQKEYKNWEKQNK